MSWRLYETAFVDDTLYGTYLANNAESEDFTCSCGNDMFTLKGYRAVCDKCKHVHDVRNLKAPNKLPQNGAKEGRDVF